MICVGATLFTSLSLELGGPGDPVRIAANIVTGVGFLGAGAILRGRDGIIGLTTAATIWLAAALGMGIGGGYYLLSCIFTAFVLVVLFIFPIIEARIDNLREVRRYEVVCKIRPETYQELENVFRECGLKVLRGKRMKCEENMICIWIAYGSPDNHDKLIESLFVHPDVREFKV